jgi:hypothetical protein
MKDNFRRKAMIAGTLTLTGILLGLLLSVLTVWGDYEASSYGFLRRAQASFRGLSCPVILGRNERGTVSVKISNPTDRTLSPGVLTQVSTDLDPESKIDHVKVPPGGEVSVQTTIGPENIDLGSFIFVDVLVYSTYPIPDRENTCGILVLPVSGALILIPGTVLSILFMAMGMYISYKNELLAKGSRSTLFMIITTLFAMLLGFTGLWFQSTILIVLVILTLMITAGSSLQE